MTETEMTKSDRDTLIKIIKQRERVAKAEAKERSLQLTADFEEQLSRAYSFDEREVWSKAKAAAEEAVDTANRQIADECARLGIPKEFAPGLNLSWWDRGENLSKKRRDELRLVARAQISAAEQAAKTAIERRSVELQEQVMVQGLTSEQARQFLASVPTVADLMPSLTLDRAQELLSAEAGRGV